MALELTTKINELRDLLMERGINTDQMQIVLPEEDAINLATGIQKEVKEAYSFDIVQPSIPEPGVLVKFLGIRFVAAK